MTTYLWLGFASLLLFGCGDTGDDAPDAGVADVHDSVAATARYIRPPLECASNGTGKAHGCA
jgi:hypothetical protein